MKKITKDKVRELAINYIAFGLTSDNVKHAEKESGLSFNNIFEAKTLAGYVYNENIVDISINKFKEKGYEVKHNNLSGFSICKPNSEYDYCQHNQKEFMLREISPYWSIHEANDYLEQLKESLQIIDETLDIHIELKELIGNKLPIC